jgi:hypothetical protein
VATKLLCLLEVASLHLIAPCHQEGNEVATKLLCLLEVATKLLYLLEVASLLFHPQLLQRNLSSKPLASKL